MNRSEPSDETNQIDFHPSDELDVQFKVTDGADRMSKNQLKKRKRFEKLMQIKKRKKEQDKEARHAKAKAEGRDLEEERRLQELRTLSGKGKQKRDAEWILKMNDAKQRFRICVDCQYEDMMTYKEKNSLASQIRYCYAANKRSKNPVFVSVPSLRDETRSILQKVEGFPDQWTLRCFECSDEDILSIHPDKEKIVYLTSDSDTTLDHLEDDKVYVIGGIVDRNRLKKVTLNKANELGIQTARLPIDEHLKLVSTKVLTVNHVCEILLKYREYGNNWKKALLDVLPERKDITEKSPTDSA
jgi:tRNA (guanine9-N1)-methyltransferase